MPPQPYPEAFPRSGPYPRSDHFDGKRFFNPGPPRQGGFFSFLRWRVLRLVEGRLTGAKSKWPRWVEGHDDGRPADAVAEGEVVVTFVNHATVLLQLPGVNLLTDPIWSERASPVSFAGPKRVRKPGVPFERLPRIDAVLLSHNHYDHLDLPTLRRLADRDGPAVLTPLGNARHLEGRVPGLGPVRELDWWDATDVKGVPVTLTPARHFAARTAFDRDRSLWGGFYVGGAAGRQGDGGAGRSVFFAGDTAWGEHFAEVRGRLGRPDLGLLPIGAYAPRWFMSPVHMDPAQAVRAHQESGAGRSVAIHFGTFQMADEGFSEPAQELRAAKTAAGVAEDAFVVPDPGESFRLSAGGAAAAG